MDFRHSSPNPQENLRLSNNRMTEIERTMTMLRAGEQPVARTPTRRLLKLGVMVILTAMLTLGLYAQPGDSVTPQNYDQTDQGTRR